MVSLSTEQFKELLEAVNKQSEKWGSFSGYRSRFNGERNPVKVEEFISAVTPYKTVESISDANAVNGMPMLLEGEAVELWHGVKSKATTFADIEMRLRDAFSPPKPTWRIYAKINESKQQKNEPTDAFMYKERSFFSQLDKITDEADQIYMVCLVRLISTL
uniref:Uncharacterized protein n=1 Tax=Musca domestica TaxID=7370 RepID=A0A1I8N8S4_MUSDO